MPDDTGLSKGQAGRNSRGSKNQLERRVKVLEERVMAIQEEIEFLKQVITADRRPEFHSA